MDIPKKSTGARIMKGFGEKILNTCEQFTAFQLSVMPVIEFAHITVEPTGIIGKMPAYLMDDKFIDAVKRHDKYWMGRK